MEYRRAFIFCSLFLALAAFQTAPEPSSDPAPTEDASASGPPTEWVAQGACPFECCMYGDWVSTVPLDVLKEPRTDAPVLAQIEPGTAFQAVTGETHTQAGLFRFSKDAGPYHAGEVLLVFDYMGEGVYRVWKDGAMEQADLSMSLFGEQSGPVGEMLEMPDQNWWVEVQAPDGVNGWVRVANARDLRGADGCG